MSRTSKNWLILLGIAALTLIADRITKTIVTNNLALNETWDPPIAIVRRFASITHITNTGAVFGIFPDLSLFFTIVAFVVITAIIVYYRHLPEGGVISRVALGLMLGGALGNLVDRLRQGYVIDFVDWNFWPLHDFPVWNVADSAIVVGVSLLAFSMLKEDFTKQDDELGSSDSDAASETGASS